MNFNDYKKYKWFFTSSGKLVVGGKSAEQNDELLRKIKKFWKELYIMHTTSPGSPFCAIISDLADVSVKDLEECAIFTGCFSRGWKEMKRKTEVHIFKLSQLKKDKKMKDGTWSIKGEVNKMTVELKLALIKQGGVYRAVPVKTVGSAANILKVCPGEEDKTKMADKIIKKLKDKNVSKNELLAALPAGGVEIC